MLTMILMGGLLAFVAIQIYHWLQSRETIPSIHTRHILVTGCDTGFGRCLAIRLDKMGCHVFAGCLTSSGAEQLSKETSERVKTLLMDVTKDEDIERAVTVVQSNIPDDQGLWGIVNNAGVFGTFGICEMMTRKEYMAPLQVNLLGMTQVTRCFLPLVRKGQGRIVNTTSVVGRFALGPLPYVASKFAATGFTEMLRRELYYHGVSVHSIEPGAYDTNLLNNDVSRRSLTRLFEASPPHVHSMYGQDYVDKVIESLKLTKKHVMSSDPEEVVDVYVHALTSKRPSLTYTVGMNGKYFFRPLRWLPTRMADWIVTRYTINPQNL